jgi:hypothetical protein
VDDVLFTVLFGEPQLKFGFGIIPSNGFTKNSSFGGDIGHKFTIDVDELSPLRIFSTELAGPNDCCGDPGTSWFFIL